MKLTLLSYNLWMLPSPLSVEIPSRSKKIVSFIRKLKPDIINFQEVWLRKYVERLKHDLKEYYIFTSPSQTLNKTGLITFSKIKPIYCDWEFFNISLRHNLIERLAKKGYLKVNVLVSGKTVSIINTHLYCPILPKWNQITLNQFKHLKKLTKRESAVATIISGDLNLPIDIFNKVNNGYFIHDNLKEPSRLSSNQYKDKRLNKIYGIGHQDEKIDYVLAKAGKNISLYSKTITTPLISDHFGIYSEIFI